MRGPQKGACCGVRGEAWSARAPPEACCPLARCSMPTASIGRMDSGLGPQPVSLPWDPWGLPWPLGESDPAHSKPGEEP